MNVAAAATRHSALNRGVMLDWLKQCDEQGEPVPSDEAIMARFGFTELEQARTLLADLADRGLIRIRYECGERMVSIGKAGPARQARCAGAIEGRTVKRPEKPDRGVDELLDRIRTIVKRTAPGGAADKLEATEPEPISSAPAPAQPRIAAAPGRMRRAQPSQFQRGRKQINVRLSPEAERLLIERAEAAGKAPSAVAIAMLEQTLLNQPEPMVTMTGKPMIRASVLRAAREEGIDLHLFVSELIDIGFECWRESMAEERV